MDATLAADQILDALDPEQRAVATALHGPVCVLAGAGTGKTRAITHRIAYGVRTGAMVPQQVLAVTFTTRAAGEMRGRLRTLGAEGVQARTFHSAALRQLQYFWGRAVGGEPPRIVERKVQYVAEAASRCGIRLSRPELRDLTAEIEWSKVTQTAPEDYPAVVAKLRREAPRDPAETAAVYSEYEQLKLNRWVIDFEDVLLRTVGILETVPEVAQQVRSQYRHLVVDEYQDVSPLQQRLLELWLGDRQNLCVVGDASQTIYSFTGATPRFLLDFRARHPDAEVVKLVRDYRSTPQVVHLANGLLAQASGEAAAHRLELIAQTEAGPEPVFTEYADEPAEAEAVAHRIRDLVNSGTKASEIAVLFRTNAQSEVYEQALADLGLAVQMRGAERFFERAEVREARVLLGGQARSGDWTGLAATSADPLETQVRAVLAKRGLTAEPPSGSGSVRERWESLSAVARLAAEFASANPGAGLGEFTAELDARANLQHAPTVEGVTLASLHAAKGLEWDAVFLVGLSEGMMPITYAKTDEALEEERRLLYVGVTRARRHLHLSWWTTRTPGGRGSRVPCRFLDGLRPGSTARPGGGAKGRSGAGAAGGGRKRGPVRCRVCGSALSDARERKLRRCSDCPSTMDEGLFERLREWRGDLARARSVPAYVVFTDATLMAIAESRPTEIRQLAEIPGVGPAKLDQYAEDVLTLCTGGSESPESPESQECDAGDTTDTSDALDSEGARTDT
nr:ATP-dependent DNA helicase UvrD2 [Mangrovactinospora gilvigrisea]